MNIIIFHTVKYYIFEFLKDQQSIDPADFGQLGLKTRR